jgi:hypothetical protein
MKAAPIKLSKFKNRSGSISWRVSGIIKGSRFRKNFASKHEAQAWQSAKEIEAANDAGSLQTIVTRLTDKQLAEAEAHLLRAGLRLALLPKSENNLGRGNRDFCRPHTCHQRVKPDHPGRLWSRPHGLPDNRPENAKREMSNLRKLKYAPRHPPRIECPLRGCARFGNFLFFLLNNPFWHPGCDHFSLCLFVGIGPREILLLLQRSTDRV